MCRLQKISGSPGIGAVAVCPWVDRVCCRCLTVSLWVANIYCYSCVSLSCPGFVLLLCVSGVTGFWSCSCASVRAILVAGVWCCNVYRIHGFTALTVQRWIARIWCCTCNCAFMDVPVLLLYLCNSRLPGFGAVTVCLWMSRVCCCNCVSIDVPGVLL